MYIITHNMATYSESMIMPQRNTLRDGTVDYHSKYIKYKNKYVELKNKILKQNMCGGYVKENFGHKLFENNIMDEGTFMYSMLDDPMFNLRSEIKLLLKIVPMINIQNEYLQKIKFNSQLDQLNEERLKEGLRPKTPKKVITESENNEILRVNKKICAEGLRLHLNEIYDDVTDKLNEYDDEQLINKIFGDINDADNVRLLWKIYFYSLHMNVYGISHIKDIGDRERDKRLVNYFVDQLEENKSTDKYIKIKRHDIDIYDKLFEHKRQDEFKSYGYNMLYDCMYNGLNKNTSSYVFYYKDHHYTMFIIVNNFNFNGFNVSEHMFINKTPSTLILEKLYDKKNEQMGENLHKYAIQTLKPTYVVSNPLESISYAFNNMERDLILKKSAPLKIPDQPRDIMCSVEVTTFEVLKNDNIIN